MRWRSSLIEAVSCPCVCGMTSTLLPGAAGRAFCSSETAQPPAWLFSSLSDGESFACWSKHSPIEKAVCDRCHIIIKKLRHQVITFTVFDGTNSRNISVKVSREKLLGVVYFADDFVLVDDLKAQLGSSFHERIPSLDEIKYIDNVGYMLHPEIFMNSENTSWWEYLLFGAIHYAQETAIVVSPPDFTIPYHAFKYAHNKGKDITQISLSRFATDEVRRLQMLYFIEFKYSRTKEASHPDELAYLIESFSDVMRQFW